MAEIVNKAISVEHLIIIGTSLFFTLYYTHIEEDDTLKMQNNRDRLFVLLFLYKRNINMHLATTDIDVAV